MNLRGGADWQPSEFTFAALEIPRRRVVFVLHLVVPGRWVTGYVKGNDGQTLRYHLNGLRVP